MSPEQRSQMPYSYSADIWALGMILFELLTLKRMDFGKLMKDKNYLNSIFEEFKDNFDNQYFEMVKMCLTINPEQRPTASNLLESLTGYKEGKQLPLLSSQISFMKKSKSNSTSNSIQIETPVIIPTVELEDSEDDDEKEEDIQIKINPIEEWTIERVGEWLENDLNFGIYKSNFFENEINGEALLELKETDEFYKYLGIKKLGHIKILQKRIRKLNKN